MAASWIDLALLATWMGLCIVLLVFASASAGRKLADIDVMRLRKVNGVRTIAARVQLRTHGNRIFMGLVFGLLGVLVVADAPIEVQRYTFRVGLVALLALFTAASVFDWRDDREQLQLVVDEYEREHTHGKGDSSNDISE